MPEPQNLLNHTLTFRICIKMGEVRHPGPPDTNPNQFVRAYRVCWFIWDSVKSILIQLSKGLGAY